MYYNYNKKHGLYYVFTSTNTNLSKSSLNVYSYLRYYKRLYTIACMTNIHKIIDREYIEKHHHDSKKILGPYDAKVLITSNHKNIRTFLMYKKI